jgi:hypothetical protein
MDHNMLGFRYFYTEFQSRLLKGVCVVRQFYTETLVP